MFNNISYELKCLSLALFLFYHLSFKFIIGLIVKEWDDAFPIVLLQETIDLSSLYSFYLYMNIFLNPSTINTAIERCKYQFTLIWWFFFCWCCFFVLKILISYQHFSLLLFFISVIFLSIVWDKWLQKFLVVNLCERQGILWI